MANDNRELPLVIRAIDRASAPLRNISARLRALSQQGGLTKLGGGIASLGKGLVGVGARIGAVAAIGGVAFGALVKSSTDAGDALGKSAKRAGLAVDEFFSLQKAAEGAGIETENFTGAIDTFTKNMGGAKLGKGKLASFLKDVSPSLLKSLKGAKGNGAALDVMFEALDRIKDPAKRAAVATAAFGESGAKIASLLDGGIGAMRKTRAEQLELYGSQVRFVEGAGAMDDALGDLGKAADASSRKFMTELFPGLSAVTEAFTGLINGSQGSATSLGETLNTGLLAVAAKLPAIFTEARVAFAKLAPLGSDLAKVFGFVFGVVLKVTDLIFDRLTSVLGLYGPLKAGFMALFAGISQALNGIAEAFQAAFRLDLSGVKEAFKKVTGAFDGANNPAQAFRDAQAKQRDEEAGIRSGATLEDGESDELGGATQESAGAVPSLAATAPQALSGKGEARPTLGVKRPAEQRQEAAAQDLGEVISKAIMQGFGRVAAVTAAGGGTTIKVSFQNVPRGTMIRPEGRANVDLDVGYVTELAR